MVASTAKHKRVLRVGVIAACVLSVLGCGGDTGGASSVLSPDQAYWTLQLNQHAVTLALTAPYNAIRLTANPLNARGQPLSGFGAVQYSTPDSTVAVDATGLVTAKFATSLQSATVIAALTDTAHHVTLTDTCLIEVTATAPSDPLATFSLHPSGDSAMIPLGGYNTITTTATDGAGNSVVVLPYFTSSDPSILSVTRSNGNISDGNIYGGRVGQVTLYATTWVYGVAKRDSLRFTVGFVGEAEIDVLSLTPTGSSKVTLTFWPQTITVGTGAIVSWVNESFTDSIDVVFDDPAHADSTPLNGIFSFGTGSGNISAWVKDTLGINDIAAKVCARFGGTPGSNCGFLNGINLANERQRKFSVAGTYHYHSIKWPTSGTINVR